jgi:hypothetical protein
MEGYARIASARLTVALIDEENIEPARWVRLRISYKSSMRQHRIICPH